MSTKTLKPLQRYQITVLVLGVFCAGAIATNFALRQGPAHDATIESDFTAISQAVDVEARNGLSGAATLPASLSELSGLTSGVKKRLANYDYKPSLFGQYQLCATFLTDGQATARPNIVIGASPNTATHTKGYQCFTYRVNVPYPVSPLPAPLHN